MGKNTVLVLAALALVVTAGCAQLHRQGSGMPGQTTTPPSSSTGNTSEHRTPSTVANFRRRVLSLLPANADKTLSRLDEQATLLRQGLYLDRRGKIKPLSPDHLKQVNENPPPPPPALPDQKVRPAKTTPIVLTVPKS